MGWDNTQRLWELSPKLPHKYITVYFIVINVHYNKLYGRTNLDKFTELTTKSVIAIIKNKLKPLEEQGIHVEIVEPKYSDICVDARLVLTLTNATSEAEAERKNYFEEHCAEVGLLAEHYGKKFRPPTSIYEYRVAGLDFHDENPVLIQQVGDNSKFYRMSILDVKRFVN